MAFLPTAVPAVGLGQPARGREGDTIWARLPSPAGVWPPPSWAPVKVSPSLHSWSHQQALLLPSALSHHAQSPRSLPGVAEGHQCRGVLESHLGYSQI